MKLFDKIKRRARDVIKAAKGEPWGELVRPVGFKRTEAKVETYRSEHFIGYPLGGGSERAREYTIKRMAEELGLRLLDAGAIKVEICETPVSGFKVYESDKALDLGDADCLVGMTVQVVRPEKEGTA